MEKNILNNYLFTLLASCERNLSAYLKDKESESLHHLRVDIKKINALLSFAEKVYREKYDTASLKSIFHQAGEIRVTQINLRLLDAVPILPQQLITGLRNTENIACQKLIDEGPVHLMNLKHFGEQTRLAELLPAKKTIINYFKKERKKAEQLLQHIDRENLHPYRKKIKKILYLYGALPKKIQDKINIDIERIDQQQRWIGDWHDTFSAIGFLSSQHFAMQDPDFLLHLKEKENTQFNALLRNLNINKRKKVSALLIIALCIPLIVFPLLLKFSGNFRFLGVKKCRT